ncbi:HAD hydrolase family protein [Streptococcus panodentis]|uniref:HAD family hydrolase n=1 Tax=Streptococcus panodentis TaxID=1581472 RepID=A0ABS5AXZ3_9STRE|nr:MULTISPECIES: HAD hydrolase family protein [Streptococcus]KXT81806.1 hypothetical protein STRDD11_01969 [Streptococcus sp. DD11]MBP2621306.1 HAD family hydrolase [Streptococcus panodentis]
MKFVFDLDGTLCFDYMTIDEELKQVLLTAPHYGHEVVFASARSYRDCLGLLGSELSQQLVIGLNGGLAYQGGQLIFERQLNPASYQAVLDFCRTYNLPFFVDNTFNYSGQILEKIPFIASVDPLGRAKQLDLAELQHPIKIVIYMGNHEQLVEDLQAQFENLSDLTVDYHEHEQCFYINPADTHKASTIQELCGENYVAFGNDQNDIEMFKNSLYAVQVGDFPALKAYADDQVALKGDFIYALAAAIRQAFLDFKGK